MPGLYTPTTVSALCARLWVAELVLRRHHLQEILATLFMPGARSTAGTVLLTRDWCLCTAARAYMKNEMMLYIMYRGAQSDALPADEVVRSASHQLSPSGKPSLPEVASGGSGPQLAPCGPSLALPSGFPAHARPASAPTSLDMVVHALSNQEDMGMMGALSIHLPSLTDTSAEMICTGLSSNSHRKHSCSASCQSQCVLLLATDG